MIVVLKKAWWLFLVLVLCVIVLAVALLDNPVPEQKTQLMSEENLVQPLKDPQSGMVTLPEPALRLEQKLLEAESVSQHIEVDRAKLAEMIKANKAAMAQLPAKQAPSSKGDSQQTHVDEYELEQRIELIKNMQSDSNK